MSDAMEALLADYGVDMDDIEAPSFDIEDGTYYFIVGDVFVQHGTKADPDGGDSLVFSYRLSNDSDDDSDGKEKREWFNLPDDPEDITEKEKERLGWYKARIISLGFEASEVNSVTRDDLIGITGTMQLVTTAGRGSNKGKTFQNIRNVKVDEEVPAAPVAATPKKKAPAKAAPAPEAEASEDDEPEEAPAKAAPKAKVGAKKTAPGNPFA